MTEGHIYDTALGEVLQVLQLAVEGQTILDTEHDRLPFVALVLIQVARGAGNAQISLVIGDNLLDLIEDKVSIFRRTCHVKIN